MNQKQKLGYMALGAGIMAIGIIIGQVITPDIEAQSNGVFDEIQCTRLTVVDKQGDLAVLLATDEDGGLVGVYGKDGESVGMGISEHGGFVGVYRKDDGSASMTTDEDGGRIVVANNQGKTRAVMGINEFGNGGVSTWDKNGYRQ